MGLNGGENENIDNLPKYIIIKPSKWNFVLNKKTNKMQMKSKPEKNTITLEKNFYKKSILLKSLIEDIGFDGTPIPLKNVSSDDINKLRNLKEIKNLNLDELCKILLAANFLDMDEQINKIKDEIINKLVENFDILQK